MELIQPMRINMPLQKMKLTDRIPNTLLDLLMSFLILLNTSTQSPLHLSKPVYVLILYVLIKNLFDVIMFSFLIKIHKNPESWGFFKCP